MKTVSGTFQGKISGGGPDGSTVLWIVLIGAGLLFGGAVVAAVVAFLHLVLEAFTVIGGVTVVAAVCYARIRYARRGDRPGAAPLACGHLATRKAVVTGICGPCQAGGPRAGYRENMGIRGLSGYQPPTGEIEPPREIHNHQHIHISDPDTASAVIKAMQDQREARP
jgi:hypothetical protein